MNNCIIAHQPKNVHVVALLSGGLDSILAIKLMEKQGVKVTSLHFMTPFFGKAEMLTRWKDYYNLDLHLIDISEDFIKMIMDRPAHGFGKVLNPCVDCKILMMRHAKRVMEELGACAIISGEVVGQRPMSQRTDTLNLIQKEAGVKGLLLRPLSAKILAPTKAEEEGLIDRSQLLDINGRGRKRQYELAHEFGLKEIPSPAGGCNLGEKEKARNYWIIATHHPKATPSDFRLANIGRQLWSNVTGEGGETTLVPDWLVIGRKQEENAAIVSEVQEKDLLLRLADYAGPVALVRFLGKDVAPELVRAAAERLASYSTKAVQGAEGGPVRVRLCQGSFEQPLEELSIIPNREDGYWQESEWLTAKAEIREERKHLGSDGKKEERSEG